MMGPSLRMRKKIRVTPPPGEKVGVSVHRKGLQLNLFLQTIGLCNQLSFSWAKCNVYTITAWSYH